MVSRKKAADARRHIDARTLQLRQGMGSDTLHIEASRLPDRTDAHEIEKFCDALPVTSHIRTRPENHADTFRIPAFALDILRDDLISELFFLPPMPSLSADAADRCRRNSPLPAEEKHRPRAESRRSPAQCNGQKAREGYAPFSIFVSARRGYTSSQTKRSSGCSLSVPSAFAFSLSKCMSDSLRTRPSAFLCRRAIHSPPVRPFGYSVCACPSSVSTDVPSSSASSSQIEGMSPFGRRRRANIS